MSENLRAKYMQYEYEHISLIFWEQKKACVWGGQINRLKVSYKHKNSKGQDNLRGVVMSRRCWVSPKFLWYGWAFPTSFPFKKIVFNSRFPVDLQITTAGYTKLLHNLQGHPQSKFLVSFDKRVYFCHIQQAKNTDVLDLKLSN